MAIERISQSLKNISRLEDSYIASIKSLAQESLSILEEPASEPIGLAINNAPDEMRGLRKERAVFRVKDIAPIYRLRSIPQDLKGDGIHDFNENQDILRMFQSYDFFETTFRPTGNGLKNIYELAEIDGDKVVLDYATGLMWHQSGAQGIPGTKASQWIKDLNQTKYAGFSDWRLPTLEELLSLMERDFTERDGIQNYVDKIFDIIILQPLTEDQIDGAFLLIDTLAPQIIAYPLDQTWVDVRPVRAIR